MSGSRSRTGFGSVRRAARRGAADPLVRLLPGAQVRVGRFHQASSEKPPSTISVWPRTISASGEQRKQTASATSPGSTSRPAGVRFEPGSRSSPRGCGKCSSAPVSTTPAETAFDADPARRELDGEVADERLERRLRDADEHVVRRARASSRGSRRRRSTSPPASAARTRASGVSSARAFAFSVQSQCLSSVSSAGLITPVAALWTSTSNGPSSAASSRDPLGGDVAAQRAAARRRRRAAPRPSPRRRGRSGGSRSRPARRPSSANRSAIAFPIPREPPVTSTDAPFERAHRLGGSGSSAGAALGISSQPGTSRRTRGPSSRLRRGVPEPVEQLHLHLGVTAHLVILGEVQHELLDPGAKLVGEVRRRRPDERVDRRRWSAPLRHGEKPNG